MSKIINLTEQFTQKTKRNGQFYLTRIKDSLFLFVELPLDRVLFFRKEFPSLKLANTYSLSRRKDYRWFVAKKLPMQPDTLDTETKHLDDFKVEKDAINLSAVQQFGPDGKILFECFSQSAFFHTQYEMDEELRKVRRSAIIKLVRSSQSDERFIIK